MINFNLSRCEQWAAALMFALNTLLLIVWSIARNKPLSGQSGLGEFLISIPILLLTISIGVISLGITAANLINEKGSLLSKSGFIAICIFKDGLHNHR